MTKKLSRQAPLRVCGSCEWIFKNDNEYKPCPKCGFGSYGARFVYGDKCYKYAQTQQPWKIRKMTKYEMKLNNEIETKQETKQETITKELCDQAIKNTIKHWENDHKLLVLFGGDKAFDEVFYPETCDVCVLHRKHTRKYAHPDTCGICPLKKLGFRRGCTPEGEPFQLARKAARNDDKNGFTKAKQSLISKLKEE